MSTKPSTTQSTEEKALAIMLAAVVLTALGMAGTGEYQYRCKQAHRMNPGEQCEVKP